MKKMLFMLLLPFTMVAQQTAGSVSLSFGLPYSEGTLYVSVTADNNQPVFMQSIEVSDNNVTVEADFSGCYGKTLSVNAFLDLNENRQLDFGDYGIPSEPCLRTSIMPSAEIPVYSFELVTY